MMALALVACGDTPANNDNDNKDNDTKTEEFARGSWDGNVYTNDSLNLTVTVPDGWKIATDEELAAIMGITIDSLTEQGVSEEFLKAQNTYEMMAQDPTNGSNVIVMAENLTVSVGGTSYDEEAYSNVIINTLPEESGYEFADPKTVTIGGRDYYLLQCTAGEGNLGQDFLFTRIGNHMVSVILSYSPCLSITPICWRCSASNKQFIQKLSRFWGGFLRAIGHFSCPGLFKGTAKWYNTMKTF